MLLDQAASDETSSFIVDLSDVSGDSNKDQEFYLIAVNASEADLGFSVQFSQTGTKSAKFSASDGSVDQVSNVARSAGHFRQNLRSYIRKKGGPGLTRVPRPAPDVLSDEDIGYQEEEFHVRSDFSDPNQYALVTAVLAALGDTVAIWVDTDQPIDFDLGCDGTVDIQHEFETYGFDNCDLQTIADIVDTNIVVNLRALFGEESDVNGDGRVTVLITPLLNDVTHTSEDEGDWVSIVEAYADPEVDLNDYDANENPGSDEQEIIYVFAPDPYGFYNSFNVVTVDEYTSMELAGRIALEMEGIISYNQHVLVRGAEPEDRWLDTAMGAVAADLTGFGAILFADAWDYLDASHLHALVTAADSTEDNTITIMNQGAQYLFARWLVDTYGSTLLSSLVQTTATGTDNVAAATGEDFGDLVTRWQVALLTTGVTNDEGAPLMDPEEWPQYADPVMIEAPIEAPDSPEAGTYYGANGYQMGIDIHGMNYYMEGGTTDSPEEVAALRVTLENTDRVTYVPGFDIYGYTVGNYSAQVFRLTDILYDETTLKIHTSDEGMTGALVRWNDPGEDRDYSIEQGIYSALDVNAVALPDIPEDGSAVYGLGELSSDAVTTAYDPTGEALVVYVSDTDRWRIDLSDRTRGEQVRLAIWLDRHYEDESGAIAPYDPWFAVVQESFVPTPDIGTITREVCQADEAVYFSYPSSVLEYLYYQVFLSDQPFAESMVGDDASEDAGNLCELYCGQDWVSPGTSATTTCQDDWDLDGITDQEEYKPTDFLEQVLVEQICTQNIMDLSTCYDEVDWDQVYTLYELIDTDNFDSDSVDEDELATLDRQNNTGGSADSLGEEAFLETILTGGESYLLIVGASGDTGTYELTIRQLE